MASVHDEAWDLPPRVAADLIAEYLNDLRSGTSLRIGRGETVLPAYVRLARRALFADALHRLAPQTTRDLACDPAYEIVAHGYRAIGELAMHPDDGQPLREADDRQDRYVAAWQHRYNLRDPWLGTAAITTMHLASDLHGDGQTYDAPLCLPGVTALTALHDTPAHWPADTPAHLDLEISTFNPRSETVDDAVKRLLPGLESQLCERLASIARDDLSRHDAVEPVTFRKTTAYEWLVRYQVLGESRNKIAEGVDGRSRPQVGRMVNQTAQLIGLTLRESLGGRPLKTRSNTKRVR